MSDTDIHSCGYYCERPACLKAQRDELRDRLAAELPLVRVEEFVEMIKGKENFRGIPVMRTEWPLEDRWVKSYSGGKPNYTQPIEKKWVGLTDEEIEKLVYNIRRETMGVVTTEYLARVIEAKLKEKNT
jgi:hypothetical protein